MTGIEFILLHVQEPILYVIRKQHRFSPTNGKEYPFIDGESGHITMHGSWYQTDPVL